MAYLEDLPGQRAYAVGVEVVPTRRSWNFRGGIHASYNSSTDKVDVSLGGVVYASSGLPSSPVAGETVTYTDHGWGTIQAYYDGTNWRREVDGCIVPTSTTDHAYLQELIDNQGAAGEIYRTIKLPAKNFDISAPLIMNGIIGLTIEGPCAAYKDQDSQNQCRIRLDDDDEAAFIVQGCRSIKFVNLHVSGMNDITGDGTPFLANAYSELMTNANFLLSGVRNNRYSPHAGFAIDPLGTVTSSSDRYPSQTDNYGETGTSREITWEHCTIRAFACGILLSPDESLNLGDSMTMRNVMFRDCRVGYASCQTQNKTCRLEQCYWEYCLIAIGTGCFGRQQGYPPHVEGGYALQVKYLLMCDSNRGPMKLRGLEGEQILSLGQWGYGNSTQSKPLVFDDCHFQIQDVDGSDRIEIDTHLIAFGNVHFDGGSLVNTSAIEGVLRIHNNDWVSFDRTLISNELYTGQGFPFCFANETGGTPATRVRLEDVAIVTQGASDQLTERGYVTGANGAVVAESSAIVQVANYEATVNSASVPSDGQYCELSTGWTPEQGTDLGAFTGQTPFTTNIPVGIFVGVTAAPHPLKHVPDTFWQGLDGSNWTVTSRTLAISSGNTFAET